MRRPRLCAPTQASSRTSCTTSFTPRTALRPSPSNTHKHRVTLKSLLFLQLWPQSVMLEPITTTTWKAFEELNKSGLKQYLWTSVFQLLRPRMLSALPLPVNMGLHFNMEFCKPHQGKHNLSKAHCSFAVNSVTRKTTTINTGTMRPSTWQLL